MQERADQQNAQIEKQLLKIVYQFLISLQKKRQADSLSLESKLTEDLAIDSLGRVEIFHQIEEAFGIYLPESLLIEAHTVGDIAKALKGSDYTKKLVTEIDFEALEETRINPASFNHLVEVLIKRGQKEPDRIHLYFQDEKGNNHPVTYGELLKKSAIVAGNFHRLGLMPGETVAIMLPTSLEFFYVFMGTMLAGLIPVPIYPPFRPDKIEEYAMREAGILRNAEVRILVTWKQAEKLSSLLKVFIPSLKHVQTADELVKGDEKVPTANIRGSSPAFIQYTSGSTSAPKGVLLTHENLLANMRAITQVIQIKPSDVGVSWLPLYHDMGLIGCWLTSFYNAIPVVIMSPLSFLSRPERWLWAIHYHRATLSAAPNFAYELCVKKILDKDIEGLDLSSWRLTFNGAEAINPETIMKFNEKFKPNGLKSTVMYPAFGLAESSVALILPSPDTEAKVDIIDKDIFEKEHRAEPLNAGSKLKPSLKFVCVGKPLPDHEAKIVDESGNQVEDRKVGKLIFKGPSMMKEYFNNPLATQSAKVDGWFDTGDYAYEADNEFYITGRKKDLIIKAGRNFYPEEIEDIVSKISGVRKGCIIAFGAKDKTWSTERLVIVAETRETQKKVRDKLSSEIIEQVSAVLGVPPDDVILIGPGKIPKTSSGKLQRSACKHMYEKGVLSSKKAPLWIQVARLSLRAMLYKLSGFLKVIAKSLYSFYVFTFTFVNVFILWLVLWFVPSQWKKPLVRHWAKIGMTLIGMPIKVINPEVFPKDGTHVYVANHASYVDAVVLLSILSDKALLIGKKEIMKIPLMGRIIKHIGTLTVDRFDFQKNIEDTQKIKNAVAKGKSVAIFPEGTFTYAAGLRTFKLGGFKIAADTEASVCPIAIAGTRSLFRGNNILLRPGLIKVYVGKCIKPKGNDWEEVARLHAKAKAFIAEHCGEPVVEE